MREVMNLGVRFGNPFKFKSRTEFHQDILDRIADVYLDKKDDLGNIVFGRIDGSKFFGKVDREARFVSIFNPDTGFYVRSGIYDMCHNDTGEDPFMASFPELVDCGVMQKCVCAKLCNVDCYQKAISRTGNNMSLENYEKILKECEGKLFQIALGGAGDVDTHENFEEILKLTREYNIVPNFTTSGITMTKEKAEICKKYCGAVACSEHFADYTDKALDMLIEAGVKTNIHFVLSNKTIDIAIDRLKNNSFKKGIANVVFLTYKNVGLGVEENLLSIDDPRVKEFFELVDTGKFHHGIGFDSCAIPGIVNLTKNIDRVSIDTCEGSRYSCYVTPDMKLLPCSFDNQDMRWAYDISNDSIQNAWNSKQFEDFRNHLKFSCKGCSDCEHCKGGCPIRREIVLCNRKEKDQYESEAFPRN